MPLINRKLISHPMNWVIISLMLIIAAAIGHTFLQYIGVTPATPGNAGASAYDNLPAGQVPADDALSAINPTAAGYTV